MRTFFTIHAGEFLFGEKAKKQFPEFDIWIPAKDRGIDLLLTDASRRRSLAFQVKMSRDHTKSEPKTDFDVMQSSVGWFTLRRDKIANSPADYWSFVLVDRDKRTAPLFVNIPPSSLLKKLDDRNEKEKPLQVYLCVITLGSETVCIETRGLDKSAKELIANGRPIPKDRDFSEYLDFWDFRWRTNELESD